MGLSDGKENSEGNGSLGVFRSGLATGTGLETEFLGALDLCHPPLVDDDLHGTKTEGAYLAFDDLEPGGDFGIGGG